MSSENTNPRSVNAYEFVAYDEQWKTTRSMIDAERNGRVSHPVHIPP